jgi:hypothetical protein
LGDIFGNELGRRERKKREMVVVRKENESKPNFYL